MVFMTLADLLRETLDEDSQDVWENELTPTPVRRFGVGLHTAGMSIRETVAILELLGVDRSHGAVWNWVHTLSEAQSDPPTATPSRVAVDEKQIEVDGEKKWLFAAIDTDSKLLLEIDVYSRRGTDPAALTRATALVRTSEISDFRGRRSCIDSPRNTMSHKRSFSSTAVAI